MRYLILLLFPLLLHCAHIDTKLYRSENPDALYRRIAADIDKSEKLHLKSSKTIAQERLLLERLQKFDRTEEKLLRCDLDSLLKKESVSEKAYLQALYRVAKLTTAIETLTRKSARIQEQLYQLKESIEKIEKKSDPQLLSQQLQYAFYKKTQQKIAKKLKIYRNLYALRLETLKKTLLRIRPSTPHPKKEAIRKIETKITRIQEEKRLVEMEKEQSAIEEGAIKPEIRQKERNLTAARFQTTIAKIDNEALIALAHLKRADKEPFYDSLAKMGESIEALPEEKRPLYQNLHRLLDELATWRFGQATALLSSSTQSLQSFWEKLLDYGKKPLFVFQEKAISLYTLLIVASILIAGSSFASLYKRLALRFFEKRRATTLASGALISNFGYYLILLLSLVIALQVVGLGLRAIFVIIGALIVGIGIGFQGLIANFASGIWLMIDRPFRVGDFIEITPELKGRVYDITLRATTIRTGDNVEKLIPNITFIKESVTNHTRQISLRRIHIPFTTFGDIDPKLVESRLLAALKESDLPYIREETHMPKVIISKIGKTSLGYELLIWVHYAKFEDIKEQKAKFYTLIYEVLHRLRFAPKGPKTLRLL